jgi:hypothetical protein
MLCNAQLREDIRCCYELRFQKDVESCEHLSIVQSCVSYLIMVLGRAKEVLKKKSGLAMYPRIVGRKFEAPFNYIGIYIYGPLEADRN